MKLNPFIETLRRALSEGSRILTDQNDQEFKTSLERWSDIDLQVPAAIVKPVSETDTVVIVRPHCWPFGFCLLVLWFNRMGCCSKLCISNL